MTGVLDGRSAVVTGASRGIGLAAARALGQAGARVALVARTAPLLRELADEIGGGALALPCDLADRSAVARTATDAIAALGGAPDILVNNAGAFELSRVEDTAVDEFARMLEVNLVAPFAFVRTLLPAMRARGTGHIITIGSIADRMTFPENGAYAASKFGLRALHQVLREEHRGSGIRTTLISPGQVDTDLWNPVDPDRREGFTPRARMLRPAAVAAAVVFAASQPAGVNIDELRLSST